MSYSNNRRMIPNSYSHYKLKEFDPKATMNDFYEALHMFRVALNDDQLSCTFKLELGTVLFTHNHRVLHGRRAHDGQRALRGGYVDLMHWRAKVMATRKRVSEATKE